MKYVFIINPVAGDGKAVETLKPKIEAYFSENPANYQILVTSKTRGGIELAKSEALSGGQVRIYSCGGDGTLFDVVNGVKDCSNVEVGIIPCGSGNDFVKYFGNSIDFFNIEGQVKGSSIPVDLIDCGKYCAINQCFIGIDSAVAYNKNMLKSIPLMSGSLGYGAAILAAVGKNADNILEVTIDGNIIPKRNYSIVVAANAPFYGGGFKSAPEALPSDGMLDFVNVDHVSRRKIISVISKFRDGKHTGLDICRYVKGRSMRVRSDRDMVVSLDGEIVLTKDITFKVKEKALKIIVPSVCTSKDANEDKKKRSSGAAISGTAPAMDKQ